MRIAYVITRADAVGGASTHVRELALAMRSRGHDAIVLVGGRGPVTELLLEHGVPFHALRHLSRAIHPWRDARALRELTGALRDRQPDLVSTHTAKAGWLGRAASARLGVPAIYTPHGLSVGERISPAAGRLFTLAERAAARWSAAIVCVSESERKLALERRIAPPEVLRVVHNGVRDVAPELRARPASEPARICCLARLETPKDHATLLAALAPLRALAWELDLVGDGPLESELREQAAALGLDSRVQFHGYRPDPEALLASAHIFVLPSRSEGFPRSVLEAMRAGLPVVASDVGGVGEAVRHSCTGLLVPPGNPSALSGALRDMLSDSAVRERMGTAGRTAYECRFRLEAMIERTAAIYHEVLQRNCRMFRKSEKLQA